MRRAERDLAGSQAAALGWPALLATTALVLGCLASVGRGAEIDKPVEAGREAFERGNFPWYDAEHDVLKPVKLAPPRRASREPLTLPSWTGNVAWALVAIVLVVLAVILLLVFRESFGPRLRPAVSGGEEVLDAQRVEALPFLAERPRGDLLALARQHYAAGNYSEAIVYLFSYELVQLDKSALVRLVRGKTNRQYLRELGPGQSLRQPLEQTMTAFESVFFGRRPLDRSAFESCWARLGEFENLSARGAP